MSSNDLDSDSAGSHYSSEYSNSDQVIHTTIKKDMKKNLNSTNKIIASKIQQKKTDESDDSDLNKNPQKDSKKIVNSNSNVPKIKIKVPKARKTVKHTEDPPLNESHTTDENLEKNKQAETQVYNQNNNFEYKYTDKNDRFHYNPDNEKSENSKPTITPNNVTENPLKNEQNKNPLKNENLNSKNKPNEKKSNQNYKSNKDNTNERDTKEKKTNDDEINYNKNKPKKNSNDSNNYKNNRKSSLNSDDDDDDGFSIENTNNNKSKNTKNETKKSNIKYKIDDDNYDKNKYVKKKNKTVKSNSKTKFSDSEDDQETKLYKVKNKNVKNNSKTEISDDSFDSDSDKKNIHQNQAKNKKTKTNKNNSKSRFADDDEDDGTHNVKGKNKTKNRIIDYNDDYNDEDGTHNAKGKNKIKNRIVDDYDDDDEFDFNPVQSKNKKKRTNKDDDVSDEDERPAYTQTKKDKSKLNKNKPFNEEEEESESKVKQKKKNEKNQKKKKKSPKKKAIPEKVRYKTFIELDMHGSDPRIKKALDWVPIIRNALFDALERKVDIVYFITGQGLHSPKQIAVLRPLVLLTSKCLGFDSRLKTGNEGIVVCDIASYNDQEEEENDDDDDDDETVYNSAKNQELYRTFGVGEVNIKVDDSDDSDDDFDDFDKGSSHQSKGSIYKIVRDRFPFIPKVCIGIICKNRKKQEALKFAFRFVKELYKNDFEGNVKNKLKKNKTEKNERNKETINEMKMVRSFEKEYGFDREIIEHVVHEKKNRKKSRAIFDRIVKEIPDEFYTYLGQIFCEFEAIPSKIILDIAKDKKYDFDNVINTLTSRSVVAMQTALGVLNVDNKIETKRKDGSPKFIPSIEIDLSNVGIEKAKYTIERIMHGLSNGNYSEMILKFSKNLKTCKIDDVNDVIKKNARDDDVHIRTRFEKSKNRYHFAIINDDHDIEDKDEEEEEDINDVVDENNCSDSLIDNGDYSSENEEDYSQD